MAALVQAFVRNNRGNFTPEGASAILNEPAPEPAPKAAAPAVAQSESKAPASGGSILTSYALASAGLEPATGLKQTLGGV